MSIEISPPRPARLSVGRWLSRWSGDVIAAVVLGALSMVAGVLVAVAWRYLTPTVQGVINIANGEKTAYYENPETKGFIGMDGSFAICAVLAGALLAAAAFFWFRKRGPVGAALALGGAGVGAAYFAAWFGIWLGPGHGSIYAAVAGVPNNGVFDLPLQLSATGVIWLWPTAAVGVYFLLMLVFGPSDEPEDPYPAAFPQWADPVDLTAPGPEQADRPPAG